MFAVVNLMLGVVVGQSDCTSSANDTLSTPGVMSTSPGVFGVSNLSTPLGYNATVSDDATATTLLVGVYQLLLGMLGLGCVTQYMPSPVMRGFITGSAAHVAVSQLQNALSVSPAAGRAGWSLYWSSWLTDQ